MHSPGDSVFAFVVGLVSSHWGMDVSDNLHVLNSEEKVQEEVEQVLLDAMDAAENLAHVVVISVAKNGDISFSDSNVGDGMLAYLALAFQRELMDRMVE